MNIYSKTKRELADYKRSISVSVCVCVFDIMMPYSNLNSNLLLN